MLAIDSLNNITQFSWTSQVSELYSENCKLESQVLDIVIMYSIVKIVPHPINPNSKA